MNEINAPRVILNSDITPKGPERLIGEISEINIGHKTENAPAENPCMNHPIQIIGKDLINEIIIPIAAIKSSLISPDQRPFSANDPPNKDPKVAPRGTTVEITEL